MVPIGVRKHTQVFFQPLHSGKENFEPAIVPVDFTSERVLTTLLVVWSIYIGFRTKKKWRNEKK